MDIQNATNKLLKFFSEKNSFIFNRDYLKLINNKEEKNQNLDEDEASIMMALIHLQELKIVSLYRKDNNIPITESLWVLNKGLNNYLQTVQLNLGISSRIANVINSFCEFSDNKDGSPCNAEQLVPEDFLAVLQIIDMLVERIDVLESANSIKKERKKSE